MSDSSIPLKTCTKCGQSFPDTAEYFNIKYKGKPGRVCRPCNYAYNRAWADNNAEYIRTRERERYAENPTPKIERAKAYAKNNPEKVNRQHREWGASNPEKKTLYSFRYNQSDKGKADQLRRRMSKLGRGDNFTADEWQACKSWWGNCCAYCNRHMQRLTVEHFIALINGGSSKADNVLPVCHTCNCSKKEADALVWLTRKFGEDKALEVLARIQEYFDSL